MFTNLLKRNVVSRPLMLHRAINNYSNTPLVPLLGQGRSTTRTFYRSSLLSTSTKQQSHQEKQHMPQEEEVEKDERSINNASESNNNIIDKEETTTTTTTTTAFNQNEQQQQQQQEQERQQQEQQQQEQGEEEHHEYSEKREKSFFERVFTVRNMLLPVTTAVVLGVFYFYDPRQEYRDRQVAERQQKQKSIKTVGAPAIGGSFTLVDTKGKPITDSEFRGKWMLVYFGFTNCPDICPEEMRKMTRALHDLEKRNKEMSDQIVPIFITCDPNRDSIQAVDLYLKEGFHERFVGLTGTPEQVKRACQRYRVYYSAPDFAEGKEDYLVDHSVFFYLMNPYGRFKEYFAKNVTAEEVSERLEQILKEYEEQD